MSATCSGSTANQQARRARETATREEQARRGQQLHADAEAWETARLRQYVEAVAGEVGEVGAVGAVDGIPVADWAAWARGIADEGDPLRVSTTAWSVFLA